MIRETESIKHLESEMQELKNIKPMDIIIPEYNDIYMFNEPDRKKYFKKKKIEVRDFYLAYSHELAKKNKLPTFTYSQFREYCLLFNNTIGLYISQTGQWVKLPLGLGKFGISKFMPRYYKPSFTLKRIEVVDENGEKKTIIKRDLELNSNNHTQGYVCKFSWIKEEARLANKGSFRHMATVKLKKHMYESIVNLGADKNYHIIDRESEMLTNKPQTKIADKAKRQKKIDEILDKK